MDYIKRLTDDLLKQKLKTFGAVQILGPKGCGKTTSAKHFASSYIELQDKYKKDIYLETASSTPSKLLIGEKPRLIDEWQEAPKIWGAVRKSVDDECGIGFYILTSSSSKNIKTPHTGTMRISTLNMYPMSLYESGESNGEVSLSELFNNPNSFEFCHSDLSIDDLIFSICRGGWPSALKVDNTNNKLKVVKNLIKQICSKDISSVDNVSRNSNIALLLLKAYARNISTLAKYETIFKEVQSKVDCTPRTLFKYLDAFKRLFIIDEIDAWTPAIRSHTYIRSGKKRNFIDPSIGVAALKIDPSYFNTDFKTLGLLFESLCYRDLKVYISKLNGDIYHFKDRHGLECDCVLRLNDDRYALIDFKLGHKNIEAGAKNLLKIEKLIKEFRAKNKNTSLRLPTLKIIITAYDYGYKRKDGILVIPIGCLKD